MTELRQKTYQDLLANATKEELFWVQGYIAGVLSKFDITTATSVSSVATTVSKITVLYGTETGNAKKLATDFALKARKQQINAKVIGMDQYKLTDLIKESYLLVIVSTHGEGEPPAAAKKWYDYIHEAQINLPNVKFGVLALGDSSYPLFCKTGEDVATQLQQLGATPFVNLQKLDVEYETEAATWFDKVLGVLTTPASSVVKSATTTTVEVKTVTKKQTYDGIVTTNILLNDEGSSKTVHHIELAAEQVDYLPGDSIGIVPTNPAEEVTAILQAANADALMLIQYKNEPFTLSQLLANKLSIFQLTERIVKKYAEITGHEIPAVKMNLLQLLQLYPLGNVAQMEQVLGVLNPIAPRLYTIASSPQTHTDEIHLTVEKDHFWVNNQLQYGLCSTQLSGLNAGASVSFFVQKNKRFKLPEQDKDIIMIGPGTGIAPFRSFLYERDAIGATGKNWLFFGEENFVTDFLYQSDIQNWVETGLLTKVNVAFDKNYIEQTQVQHKLLQHGETLYDWLQNGAYLYLCGQKEPMSIEVEKALLQIIEQYGKKTVAQATVYINDLKTAGRYAKDVY